ncbi:MAG: AAC(3) family N-acetyltransferase [Chloroflexota bacterium]|nr:AAC(3) family N-acetyltransferase [Chloroflexota bacterium]MDE2840154.1 AAC(3) family N-acetyltransferase [Chloroflexota bacterium]MDE2930403.1 AAC(3) family N-acetyltransferase [Chloroflexota bacterium]
MAPSESAARAARRMKDSVEPEAAASGYMDHEPGDPSVRVTQGGITDALRNAGLRAGDTVLFHSSLSSMGTVVGGADAVIDGFLDAVGPAGTVAVPTLSNWRGLKDRHRVWDHWSIVDTPTYCGLIPETFRRRPEALRSNHYTHSVSAIGLRAAELTANHGETGLREAPWGPGAFAAASPWQRFYDWNVFYCLIGVNCQRLTMVHFVETHLIHRAIARAAPDRRKDLLAQVSGWTRGGIWAGIGLKKRLVAEELFAEKGLLHYGIIGSARLRSMRMRPMVDAWIALAENDPAYWCSEGFARWAELAAS